MNQMQTLTPAALYARVSSDRPDVDLSVSAQLRALRDYADRNGYVVVREYVDEAESGRVARSGVGVVVAVGVVVGVAVMWGPGLAATWTPECPWLWGLALVWTLTKEIGRGGEGGN